MLNDYQKQAIVWDWDAYDETPEYEYWCKYATQFGKNVLIPMCAHGQTGAYMAKKGFSVVAFDITPEMIAEGKKRFSSISGLELVIADILNLDLNINDIDFSFIAGNGDLHLLQTVKDIELAFTSLHKHIRTGGCLALEITLPPNESYNYPKKIFHPRITNYSDKNIWKENEVKYDAKEKRQYIDQTVYIEDQNGIEAFLQNVCLQYYDNGVIQDLLKKCGFIVKGEYSDRLKTHWKTGDGSLFIEAIKK